ncbi:MAG: type II toxin-antitoxin system RelE/ParE family toxin [Gemmatimonadales bacterium]|nr:type II toxin-antitoxin system RelE/ParE family toxin [Gemmatimonadales bacterium]
MKLIWAPRAIARASEIAAHIALDRPGAAAKWVDAVFAAVATLKAHPRCGRAVPEINRPKVRELLYGAYRIICRQDPGRVVVLTIRHARRDWDPAELVAED